MCRGLVWLHSAGLVHGDIKSANILLDCNFIAKLGDFGFAQELPKVTPGRTLVIMKSVAKTPGYSAPELDTRHQSHKTDMVWLLWNPYLWLNPMMKRGRTAL